MSLSQGDMSTIGDNMFVNQTDTNHERGCCYADAAALVCGLH